MNILFSPVSDTDPISERIIKGKKIYTDGSLIHILRHYDIDKVYLYLSKEMLDYEDKDNRYTKAIKRISEYKYGEDKIICVLEKREKLVNVHKYDYFYKDFHEILSRIRKEADGGNIYLNISSGTPAMTSALFTIHQLGDFKYTSIQVSTPFKRAKHPSSFNESWWNYCRDDKPEKYYIKENSNWIIDTDREFEKSIEYDNKKDIEDNDRENVIKNTEKEDGEYIKENPKGRCSEEESLNLLDIKYSEIVKELISKYEYYPAKVIIRDKMNINKNEKEKFIKLLELAHNRLLLNFDEVDNIIDKSNLNISLKDIRYYRPFDKSKEDSRKYLEYALSLDIKVKKTQYGDFIRALSPIIVDIFAMIIKECLKIDIYKDLCSSEEKVWDIKKLKTNNKINNILKRRYNNKFNYGVVYSSHLIKIIEDRDIIRQFNSKKYNKILEVCKNLRNIEKKVRNTAAHQIVSITDEDIKKQTGFESKDIVEKIKQALEYSGINIKSEYWNSYSKMNESIIKILEN